MRAVAAAVLAFFFLLLPAQAADFGERFLSSPHPAPSFVFWDSEGSAHALSDFRGKFVILSVWATWCPPCALEMPSLDDLQQRFDPRDLVVIPVSQDAENAAIRAFYLRHGLRNLPVMIDVALNSTSALRLQGLPTTLVIDREGNEIARVEGNIDWTSPKSLAFLRERMGFITQHAP